MPQGEQQPTPSNSLKKLCTRCTLTALRETPEYHSMPFGAAYENAENRQQLLF